MNSFSFTDSGDFLLDTSSLLSINLMCSFAEHCSAFLV